ncbi:558_t:CDS:2 [Paraglomus brasilianum]|uniref:558_t:CDS:1 n=1 Tax=Paraglomus brasilianum TaxID=144538 RepID=A0A9N9H4W3_9GLOM|nr:558_t:CDS:2 [Paraglomus brasilianum]
MTYYPTSFNIPTTSAIRKMRELAGNQGDVDPSEIKSLIRENVKFVNIKDIPSIGNGLSSTMKGDR